MSKCDVYKNMAADYGAMVPDRTLKLAALHNTAAEHLITTHINAPGKTNLTFLDPAAGNGLDGFTIANRDNERFASIGHVILADFSPSMAQQIENNRTRITEAGIQLCDTTILQGGMADIVTTHPHLRENVDVALITHTLVQSHDFITTWDQYREYVTTSLSGIRETLSGRDGLLVVDFRDWENLIPQLEEKNRQNIFLSDHTETQYAIRYKWELANEVEALHTARITLQRDPEKNENGDVIFTQESAPVQYGGMTRQTMLDIFADAGLTPVGAPIESHHCLADDEPYLTFALQAS